MRVIILAAGTGNRLRPYTDHCPKPLVSLFGQALLDQQISNFQLAGVHSICLVTGYQQQAFEAYPYPKFFNPEFASTNMLFSLMRAQSWLDGQDDTIVCYGDILTEPRLIKALISANQNLTICSDKSWYKYWIKRTDDVFSDIESFEIDENDYVLTLGQKVSSLSAVQGQYIGLFKIPANVQEVVIEHYRELMSVDPAAVKKMYMTDFLLSLIKQGIRILALQHDRGWLELDTADEKQRYEIFFEEGRMEELGYHIPKHDN